MGGRMDLRIFLLVALVAKAYSGPLNLEVDTSSRSCASTCTENTKFQYLPGNSYNFKYEVETKTAMQGSSEDHSTLKITANVGIDVITKCELSLQLRDVAVYGSDPSYPQRMVSQDPDGEFRMALEKVPLRFSFQDGVVEELCPDDADTSWALNIKRGVLSSFQNSMDSFEADQKVKEIDVTGGCHSQYTVAHRGWYSISLKKSRDLMTCTDRHGVETMIQSTPYRLPKELQSLPLMKSTHQCDQEISTDGVMKRVVCHELHIFRPFSKDNSGAMTEATQKLDYVDKRPITVSSQGIVTRRSNLLFEHTQGESPTERNRQEAERRLEEICRTTEHDIRPSTPQLFAGLVTIMKTMDFASLERVYSQVKTRRFCPSNEARTRKFFVDAIPVLGTGAAVGMMARLISANEITTIQADMWLTSLSFIQHPTKEMLSEITPLMKQKDVNTKVFLALSTMIHSYCLTHPTCEQDTEVGRIISTLEGNLGQNCRVEDSNYQTVLMSLRALGNAGHAEKVTDTLNKCSSNAGAPAEIRVGAVQAFRRLTCQADRSQLLNLFKQTSEDSELRIEAYLAVMKCATDDVISQVKQMLASEKINQVGSFVWSHLTNLMETSDPHKQSIRDILEDEILQKEFDLDKRKYSRNYEGSFFSEKLNMGAAVDSNLIWSSESFIPRSVMANLTVDLFGRSVNLLEVGGRMEGLEYILESYLGPQGYFNSKPGPEDDEEPYEANRIVKQNKLDRLERQFGKGMDDFKASAYVRVFGNELRYMDLKNFGTDFNFLNFLMKISKEQDYSFTQNFMFLDSSIIIPTSVGLPLNLTIKGSASVDMKLSGRMDLRSPSSNLVIDGTLQPSGAVAMAAVMSVDAFTTKSGLKMASTLHSSSAVKGRMELSRNQLLSVEFGLPKDRMEILDVKSSFFITHNTVDREQQMITENKAEKTVCSGSRLAKLTGMELCGEIRFPNASQKMDAPYFPLTGPVSLSLVLHKRDSHTGYKFEAKNVKTREERTVGIMFDTPGSQTDRAVSVDAVIRNTDRSVEANLKSPWKKASFQGRLVNSDDLKRLSGNLVIDETRRYSVNSEVHIDRRGDTVRYTPNVEISIPQRQSVTLTGNVEYQHKQKMVTDLSLNGALTHPVILKSTISYTDDEVGAMGSFGYEDNREYSFESRLLIKKVTQGKRKSQTYEPRLSIRMPTEELINLNGSVVYKPEKSVNVDLTLGELFRSPVTLQAYLTQSIVKKKNRSKYQTRITFQAPVGTSKFGMTIDKRAKTLATRGRWDLNFAKLARWAKDTVKFTGKVVNRSTKSLKNYDVKMTVESARFSDYNNQVALKLAHNDRTTSADIEVKYGDNMKDSKKVIAFKTRTNHRIGKAGVTLTYDSVVKYPAMKVDMHFIGSHEHTASRVISAVHVQYATDKVINASITLKNDTRDLPKYFGEVSLDYPGQHYRFASHVSQNSRRQYSANVDLELNIGQKTTVASTYSHPSDCAYEVQCNILGDNQEPIEITAGLNMDRRNFLLNTKVRKGSESYGVMASAEYPSDNYGRAAAELELPTRTIKGEFEGGRKGIQYITKGDIKWDANRDSNQRLLFDVLFNFRDIESFESTVSARYLNRAITANLKHQAGDRYVTHGEVSWSPRDRIIVDVKFGSQTQRNLKKIDGSFQFSSPFTNWENVEAQVSQILDRNQYTSKVTFSWRPNKKIVGTVILDKNISPRNLNFEGTVTAPFNQFQLAHVKLVHKLTDVLASSVIAKYNRESIELDVGGQFDVTLAERTIKGDLKWQSSLRNFESIMLTIEHHDDLGEFVSKLNVDNNGQVHTADFQMSNSRRGWQITNSASFSATSPRDSVTGSWSHRNTNRGVHTSVTSTWKNGYSFQADLRGNAEFGISTKVSGSLDMQIPSEIVRQIEVQFKHEHGIGFISTDSFLKRNKQKIAVFVMNKKSAVGRCDMDLKFTNPFMEDIIVNVNARYAAMPLTGHADFQWAPFTQITVDGSIGYDLNLRTLDADFRFTTPFRAASQVVFQMNHNRDGLDWRGTSRFEYSPRHIITMETRYRFDLTKKMSLTMSTPFQMARQLETGFEFNGNLQNFDASADFELQPVVGKISAKADWNFESSRFQPTNLKGKLRITTPYPRYPYMQASIISQKRKNTRTNAIVIEYIPTQIIRYETEYRMTRQDSIEGTMTFRSPFSDEIRATFSHQGDLRSFRQFQTHADIVYNRFEKIVADASFSMDPNIAGSFSLTSPIRGYETVNLNFNHEGSSWRNFHCTAVYDTNGKKIEMESRVLIGRTIDCKAVLKTPFSALKIAQASFSHEGRAVTDFHTTAVLQRNDQKFETDAGLKIGRKTAGKAMIKIPFPVLRSINSAGLTFSHEGRRLTDFYTTARLEKNGQAWGVETGVDVESKLAGKVLLITPLHVLRTAELSFSHQGQFSEQNFRTEGTVQYNEGILINGVMSHNDTSTSADFNIKSPVRYLPDFRTAFNKQGSMKDLNADLMVQYAPSQVVDARVQHNLKAGEINTNFTLTTPFWEDIKAVFSHEGRWRNFRSVVEGAIGPDTYLKSENSFRFREGPIRIDASSVLTAALSGTEKVSRMTFTHVGPQLNFQRVLTLEYDGKKVEYDTRINAETWKHVEVDIQSKMPFEGYHNYHITYNHEGDEKGLRGTCQLETGGKQLSGTFTAVIAPTVDVTVSAKTPFLGYEDLAASLSYEQQRNKYITSASVMYARGQTITASSVINNDRSSLTGNARVSTPFTALQSIEVDFTQDGPWRNSRSQAMLRSSRFAPMQGEATLSYTSVLEMNGQLKLSSSIENYENVKLSIKNSRQGAEYRSQVEMGLDEKRKLSVDGSWKYEEGRRDIALKTGLTVATPFSILRSGSVTLDHSHSSQSASDKIIVQYNSETYLDLDTTVEKSPKYSGAVTVRKPRPMAAKVTGILEEQSIQGQAYLDWNTEDSQSNIELDGSYSDNSGRDRFDKGISFKAVHPSRTVGLQWKLRKDGSTQLTSTGEVVWNEREQKKASYSVQFRDRSRRQYIVYEGTVNMRGPIRSMELSGAFNDNQRKKVVDATIFWDPQQDRSKKADFKAEIETGGATKQVALNAKFPTVKRDLSLNTQWQASGSTVFDGRTEFIYSKDTRKNILVRSRVEDLSTNAASNYSVSFGLSHLYTNIDLSVSGNFGHSDSRCHSSLDVGYLTAQRERKNLALRTEINKLRQRRTMDFEISTPTKSLSLAGEAALVPPYRLSLRNKATLTRAVVSVNPELQTFDLQVNYDIDDPKKSLRASGKMDGQSFEAEVYRTMGLEHISDSLLAVHLNTSRILHTHLQWRPSMLRDMSEFALNSLKRQGHKANVAFMEVTEVVGEEVASKFGAIRLSVAEEVEPITQYLAVEMADLQRDLDNIRRELKKMYKRNDLYLQEIGEFCAISFRNILMGYTDAVSRFKLIYSSASTRMEELTNEISEYPLKQRYDEVVAQTAEILQEYRQIITEKVDRCMAKASRKLNEYANMYQEKMDHFTDTVRDQINDGLDLILQHPQMKKLRSRYSSLVENFPELPPLHDIDFQKYLKQLHWHIKKGLRGSSVSDMYNTVYSHAKGYLDELAQMDELKQAYGIGNEVYQQGLWTYRYWQLDENFKLFMKNLLNYVEKSLAAEISQVSDMLANLDKSQIIEFDLDAGEIEFELYLPFELDSFNRMPRLNIAQFFSKYIKKMKYMVDKYTPDRDFCLWDYYYKYKPSSNPRDWVPPFTAYGIVSGSQHFITFDKHHYDFAGQCSYVLAKDYVDNNFTAILNYFDDRRAQIKSLLVMTNGKNVEIFPDYTMKVNSRPVELPYTFNTLTIHRSGHTVLLDSGKGLNIIADLDHDYYAIGISGWYFGKTAGLLGSYDNEPHNDVTGDIAQFASSMEVGSHCRSSRNFATSVDIDSEENLGYLKCAALFKDSSSPFRRCFKQVEPQTMLHHCLLQTDSGLMNEESLCNSSALYVHQCKLVGVDLRLPKHCVRCSSSNGQPFLEGETISMTGKPDDHTIPQSADIVVVVEEKECNRELGQKLKEIVYQTELALKKQGLTDNHYGLMGFGKEFHGQAHEHTIEGQLMNEHRKFAKGVESLQFTDTPLAPSDSLASIMAAANYPFRSGVSKTIILMACSACSDSPDYSYSTLSSFLKAREITLHVLRSHNLELSSNRSPKNRIFGIDADEAYTPRDRNDVSLDGSEDLMEPLTIPSDTCSRLAMATKGSLFDSSHIIEDNVRQQNAFLNVFSRRVSQTATPSDCQVCKCVLDDTGIAKSVCQGCDSSYSWLNYLPTVTKVNPAKLANAFNKQFQDFFGFDETALEI